MITLRFTQKPLRLVSLFAWYGVLLLLTASHMSYAAKRVELYSDSQLVLDQTPALRKQATIAGLSTVIIRVSGYPQVINHPLVKQALSKANTYLSQYSYRSTDETLTIAGDVRPAHRLSLQFSAMSVQRLLKTAQLPIWPDNRPEVLLWVVSGTSNKQLLETEALEVLALKQVGTQRGLPISTPLLDLQDRQALSPARVWALDEQTITQASERYDMDGVLAGRVNAVSETLWRGEFILIHKGQYRYLNGTGATLQEVANTIVNQAANYFASVDAIVINDENNAPTLTIQVNNIRHFDHYAGLLAYLESLPVVANVVVNQINRDQVTLVLGYNGSPQKVLSVLSDSQLIAALPNALESASSTQLSNTTPTFFWRNNE